MKNLILVFVAAITLFSCSQRQASNQLASEKMTALELQKKYGIVLDLDYGGEDATASPNAKGGKKAKAESITLSVFTDLTLTESGGVLTTTLSPNAEWGGVQKFFTVDTTNNGVSVCNWNWSNTTALITQTCATNGTGSYRSWTSDKVTYDVHLSAFLPL